MMTSKNIVFDQQHSIRGKAQLKARIWPLHSRPRSAKIKSETPDPLFPQRQNVEEPAEMDHWQTERARVSISNPELHQQCVPTVNEVRTENRRDSALSQLLNVPRSSVDRQ